MIGRGGTPAGRFHVLIEIYLFSNFVFLQTLEAEAEQVEGAYVGTR
jgi:hypothetical protein